MASRPRLWTVIQSSLLSVLVWSPAVSLRLPAETSAEDYGLPPCMAERLRSTQMTTFGEDDSQHLHDLGLGNIYVLHYKKLSERRRLGEEQLRAKNLSATFVTGWDGEEIGDADLECMYPRNGVFDQLARDFKFASSWLHLGELSLSVKHVAAAYDAVRRGHNSVLILEDDFVLTDNFTAGLSALLSPRQWEDNRTFDIIWLGSYYKNRETDLSRGTQIVRDQTHKGTIGYVRPAGKHSENKHRQLAVTRRPKAWDASRAEGQFCRRAGKPRGWPAGRSGQCQILCTASCDGT